MNLKVPSWLFFVAVMIIIVMIFLWPAGQSENFTSEREQQYKRENAILKLEQSRERAAKDSILVQSKQRARKDSVIIKMLEVKNKLVIQKAKEAESRIPKEQLTPAVVEALAAKDTVIASIQTENDSLRASLYDTGKEFIAFQEADINEDRIVSQMMQQCEVRNIELMDEIERLRKRPKSLGVILRRIGEDAGFFGLGYIFGKASN